MQIEPDEAYYEKPQVTMERLLVLESEMAALIRDLSSAAAVRFSNTESNQE